jgi:hypothetical protein
LTIVNDPFDEDRVLREHLATFGGDALRESWRACSTGPQPYRDAMLREMVTRSDLADLAQLIGMADNGWPAASVGGQDETILASRRRRFTCSEAREEHVSPRSQSERDRLLGAQRTSTWRAAR